MFSTPKAAPDRRQETRCWQQTIKQAPNFNLRWRVWVCCNTLLAKMPYLQAITDIIEKVFDYQQVLLLVSLRELVETVEKVQTLEILGTSNISNSL